MESDNFDLGLSFDTQTVVDLSDVSITDTQIVAVAEQYDPDKLAKKKYESVKETRSAVFSWNKEKPEQQRFTLASKSDVSEVKANRVPKNTRFNTSWGLNTYNAWVKFRNQQQETYNDAMGPVPETFLQASLQSVDYWMSRFVLEARRQDGKPYPPNTLHSIVLAVQRHYVEHHNRPDLNMMLKENAAFQGFRQTLDGKMKELHAPPI